MTSHIGVSCDSCLKTNFSCRRYKCLLCDNYDLCGLCYDMNSESQNHLNTHPMQCILTKTAYELFYSGEIIPYRTIVSLTCPYCGLSGFISHTLLIHCLEKHSDNQINQIVICPICVINPIQEQQIHFISLVDHIIKEHNNENLQEFNNKKEDFDENDGLPLYILAERLFIKEENHRQRFAQTIVRNDRHLLSRQSIMRNSRGHHFNNYPYETISRTTNRSFHIPFDTTISSDPYATILFSQDPLFDFDSSFSDLTTTTPFFLTSSVPTHIPSLESTTNDQIIHKKSNLSNRKQKRSNHIQQSSTQSIIESSISNHQLWEENFLTNIDIINENDPRSLLEKILKIDHNNELIHDHTSFLQSLFFSSMNISINKE